MEIERNAESLVLDESLLHQERLLRSLLGMFCGRVAHDLGNPLAAAKGFAQLIGMVDAPPKVKEHAQEIVNASNKMQAIIEQLRSFARRTITVDSRQIDVNQNIQNVTMLLGPQLERQGITLELALVEKIEPIWGNPHQIESLFYHLITYSRDAFQGQPKDKADKRITIRTSNAENGEVIASVFQNAGALTEDGRDAVLHAAIFSKNAEQVSGVGLAVIRSIVEKLRGRIELVGGADNTTFVFSFPKDRRDKTAREVEKPASVPVAKPASPPSMLIIDDEPAVGEMLALSVGDAFEVTVMTDPLKAIALIQSKKFDLIITDMRMPGMSGLTILSKVKEFQPGTPVVVVSGQLSTDSELMHAAAQGAGVMEKPFESPDMIKRSLLGRLRPRAS